MPVILLSLLFVFSSPAVAEDSSQWLQSEKEKARTWMESMQEQLRKQEEEAKRRLQVQQGSTASWSRSETDRKDRVSQEQMQRQEQQRLLREAARKQLEEEEARRQAQLSQQLYEIDKLKETEDAVKQAKLKQEEEAKRLAQEQKEIKARQALLAQQLKNQQIQLKRQQQEAEKARKKLEVEEAKLRKEIHAKKLDQLRKERQLLEQEAARKRKALKQAARGLEVTPAVEIKEEPVVPEVSLPQPPVKTKAVAEPAEPEAAAPPVKAKKVKEPKKPEIDSGKTVTAEDVQADVYRLRTGDELDISVWGHGDLHVKTPIREDGSLSFPLIGEVRASDRTLKEVELDVQERLDEDYIVRPQVTARLTGAKFSVFGEVERPGSFNLEGQTDLLTAISVAGGITKFGSNQVEVIRGQGEEKTSIRTNVDKVVHGKEKNVVILPHDTIYVKRRLF